MPRSNAAADPRPPRRAALRLRTESAILHALRTHLDWIDGRTLLDREAIGAVNAVLDLAAPMFCRMPRHRRPAPFSPATPLMQDTAVAALERIRRTIEEMDRAATEGPSAGF